MTTDCVRRRNGHEVRKVVAQNLAGFGPASLGFGRIQPPPAPSAATAPDFEVWGPAGPQTSKSGSITTDGAGGGDVRPNRKLVGPISATLWGDPPLELGSTFSTFVVEPHPSPQRCPPSNAQAWPLCVVDAEPQHTLCVSRGGSIFASIWAIRERQLGLCGRLGLRFPFRVLPLCSCLLSSCEVPTFRKFRFTDYFGHHGKFRTVVFPRVGKCKRCEYSRMPTSDISATSQNVGITQDFAHRETALQSEPETRVGDYFRTLTLLLSPFCGSTKARSGRHRRADSRSG